MKTIKMLGILSMAALLPAMPTEAQTIGHDAKSAPALQDAASLAGDAGSLGAADVFEPDTWVPIDELVGDTAYAIFFGTSAQNPVLLVDAGIVPGWEERAIRVSVELPDGRSPLRDASLYLPGHSTKDTQPVLMVEAGIQVGWEERAIRASVELPDGRSDLRDAGLYFQNGDKIVCFKGPDDEFVPLDLELVPPGAASLGEGGSLTTTLRVRFADTRPKLHDDPADEVDEGGLSLGEGGQLGMRFRMTRAQKELAGKPAPVSADFNLSTIDVAVGAQLRRRAGDSGKVVIRRHHDVDGRPDATKPLIGVKGGLAVQQQGAGL